MLAERPQQRGPDALTAMLGQDARDGEPATGGLGRPPTPEPTTMPSFEAMSSNRSRDPDARSLATVGHLSPGSTAIRTARKAS